jgi:hypothetical protein
MRLLSTLVLQELILVVVRVNLFFEKDRLLRTFNHHLFMIVESHVGFPN